MEKLTMADGALDALLRRSPVMMHLLDAEGCILDVSEAEAEFLGYRPDEMIGRPIEDFIHSSDASRLAEELWPRFREEGRMRTGMSFLGADGDSVPVCVEAVAHPQGIVVILSDSDEAAQSRRDLERALLEAQEAMKAKSRFLAAMSHEIRTPMNAVMGFAQLLQMSDLPAAEAAHVDAILLASRTTMDLLTDLLDLGRMESQRMRLNVAPFDPRDILAEAGKRWGEAAGRKGLTFSAAGAPGLAEGFEGDRARVVQIVGNLVENAIKFSESGHISMTFGGDGAPFWIEVRDQGPGLPDDADETLFHPFTQAEAGVSYEGAGWGLGLSICRGIAEAMDGRIAVVPSAKGAHFRVELMLDPAPASDFARGDGPAGRAATAITGALQAQHGLSEAAAPWTEAPPGMTGGMQDRAGRRPSLIPRGRPEAARRADPVRWDGAPR